MIFGNINQEKTYEFLPENVKACFKYVKEHDLLNYEKYALSIMGGNYLPDYVGRMYEIESHRCR